MQVAAAAVAATAAAVAQADLFPPSRRAEANGIFAFGVYVGGGALLPTSSNVLVVLQLPVYALMHPDAPVGAYATPCPVASSTVHAETVLHWSTGTASCASADVAA